MNRCGKTSTIFLVIISVLLLMLTGITLFYYNNESTLRKSLELKLSQTEAAKVKIDSELKEAKKQALVLEEKMKEADDRVNNLVDELDLQESVKEQMKSENATLKDALTKEGKEKEAIVGKLKEAQDKLTALETKFQASDKLRAELEQKINSMDSSSAAPEPSAPAPDAPPVVTPEKPDPDKTPPVTDKTSQSPSINLDKIVVTTGDPHQGRVVSINRENNFMIFNLGREHGIDSGMILSVYHAGQYVGDVKVARVERILSVADFLPPLTNRQISKDDPVVLKQ